MNQQKVIIDTDPGVDDAMAIIYAILEPAIKLVGLTSIYGNVTIEIATRNTLRLAEMADYEIPVAAGAAKPLVQELKPPSTYVHGAEGFGDIPAVAPKQQPVDEPAHEFICRMANTYPGELVLCPVGPLTNLALALDHDLSIVDKVKSVTVMGGSLEEGGNVTEFAEANIWQDPHAAERVFSADWPITMIGLDVTHKIVCIQEEFSKLASAAPKFGGFLNEAVPFYMDFHRKDKRNPVDGCHMHDPTAVISIVNPGFFTIDVTPVSVILKGEELGQTVRDTNKASPLVRVAMQVDAEAVRDKFMQIIASGS
ncbi:MAG: nucleoside hydrolase [Pseudomonadota bacterium]